MAEVTDPSVFISYTGADNKDARRVYDDLKRSGFNVWSYEVDSILGMNYATDYQHELQTREYFCLLDSPTSRTSAHVQHECQLARERQERDPDFKVIPCLIRDRSPDWFESDLLFPEQPLLQYVNLAQNYQAGMERLCRHLGGRKFFPFSDLPEDNDFLEEITASPNIPLPIYDELTSLYRRFRDECGMNPATARTWIQSVISVIKSAGAEGVATPWIALGVLDSDAGDFVNAAIALDQATRNRQDSDRAWCARAGVNMALGNYREALHDYQVCRSLLVEGHPNLDNLPMVVFGIAMSFLRLGFIDRAARALDDEWGNIGGHGLILQLRARLFLEEHRPDIALTHLESARRVFELNGESVPVEVFLTLAQTYRNLGRKGDEQQVVTRAVEQFENDPEALRSIADQMIDGSSALPLEFLHIAVRVCPNSFVYRAELASILYATGRMDDAVCEAEPCRYLEDDLNRSLSPRERYYQGLAYRILGMTELAEHALQRARRRDQLIASWPSYDELLNRHS